MIPSSRTEKTTEPSRLTSKALVYVFAPKRRTIVAPIRLVSTTLVPLIFISNALLADPLAVLVKFASNPVNVTAALFQVCERSSTGALAVSVPLLAVSVVNAPEFGVVEPMAGGAAKSEVKAMVPEASGAVSVRVVPVVRPERES